MLEKKFKNENSCPGPELVHGRDGSPLNLIKHGLERRVLGEEYSELHGVFPADGDDLVLVLQLRELQVGLLLKVVENSAGSALQPPVDKVRRY